MIGDLICAATPLSVFFGLLVLVSWILEDVLPKFPKSEEFICRIFKMDLEEYRNGIEYEEDFEDEEEELIEV